MIHPLEERIVLASQQKLVPQRSACGMWPRNATHDLISVRTQSGIMSSRASMSAGTATPEADISIDEALRQLPWQDMQRGERIDGQCAECFLGSSSLVFEAFSVRLFCRRFRAL